MQWLKIRLVYYLTLSWNVLLGRILKIRPWWSEIDPFLLLGALPFSRDVQHLHHLGVKAVVNTCLEYPGPVEAYQRYGIEQFYMPTEDFTEPRLADINRAVEFIQKHVGQQNKVYVHCKAGRARSATVLLCWLCRYRGMTPAEAQNLLLEKRSHVNPRIKDRAVVKAFLDQFGPSTPAG